jgi:hypothetical protein
MIPLTDELMLERQYRELVPDMWERWRLRQEYDAIPHRPVEVRVSGWMPEVDYTERVYRQRWQNHPLKIDERLAPLVELLWSAGVRTTHSCQGHWGEAMIGIVARDHIRLRRRLPQQEIGWRVEDEPGELVGRRLSDCNDGTLCLWFPTERCEEITQLVRQILARNKEGGRQLTLGGFV